MRIKFSYFSLIFVVAVFAMGYWGGKLDERIKIENAAIYHGCASAKEIKHGTDDIPSLDLNTFQWNINP